MDHLARYLSLQDRLGRHEAFWRPAPFHITRPEWCARQPEWAAQALALDDAEVERLNADNGALIAWATHFVPELSALQALIELPRLELPADAEAASGRLAWGMPGRKQAQAEAFAEAVDEIDHPITEWCAGKGHLGRLLAVRSHQPVLSLDFDATLCREGELLAERAHVDQHFVCADALDADAAMHLAGRHAVALHACGDLHLALLRGAVQQHAAAVDLSPCCYYRTRDAVYRPLNPEGSLQPTRDELHLPVTDTATAGARDRRLRDQAMAWKLAFLKLREDLAQVPTTRTFTPVPSSWLSLGFEAWCRKLAAREGIAVPMHYDWLTLEAFGWQRQREVMRLSLVRHVFRRPLEVWLVLDRALYLERAGYRVRLAEFCGRGLTPRNLFISARI
ncbi:MAG: methyltransferase [Hydrogenophilaceae bacterium]|nr:methyltransferase [Hydrogenophilaceae bacterium]